MKRFLLFAGLLVIIGNVGGQEIPNTGDPLEEHDAWGYDQTEETMPNNRNAYIIQKHRGISLSAHSYYGGLRFYNQESSSPYGYNGTMVMAITDGKVGIGTTIPKERFQIGEKWTFHDGGHKLIGYNTYWDGVSKRITVDEVSVIRFDSEGNISFESAPSGQTEQMFDLQNNLIIKNGGNVGIGTTTDLSAKLTVNGNIKATRIDVVSSITSDFVFEENYKLRSLKEVEEFVTQNKHLPEIPSANELNGQTYNLGEMDDLLLRKVEELTLYIIEQQKAIEGLKERNNQMQQEIEKLK